MEYWVFGLLMLSSCFFSGSETALFSIGKVARMRLTQSTRAVEQTIMRLLDRPRDLLITVLLGNELTNIGLSITGAMITSKLFSEFSLGAQALLSSATVLPILLVTGEITPKTVAALKPEELARLVARPLALFARLTQPVRWGLRAITNAVMARLGHAADGIAPGIDESEFRTLVDVGAQEGVVEAAERALIHNVLDFGDTHVADIYRPLDRCFLIDERSSTADAVRDAAARRHSRIPVFRGERTQIVGVVYAKDLLAIRWAVHPSRSVRSLMRPALFTHARRPADELLDELRQSRTHISIVVDEFGRAQGICTMEDLLEELFGPITDNPAGKSLPPGPVRGSD